MKLFKVNIEVDYIETEPETLNRVALMGKSLHEISRDDLSTSALELFRRSNLLILRDTRKSSGTKGQKVVLKSRY